MALHNKLGTKGEELAADYLQKHGYNILHKNWRHSHYEIDIVALKNQLPHFVEVKTRSSWQFGTPEESVNRKKILDLLKAANRFLIANPQYTDFRINILSITIHQDRDDEYFFIEDVYLWFEDLKMKLAFKTACFHIFKFSNLQIFKSQSAFDFLLLIYVGTL